MREIANSWMAYLRFWCWRKYFASSCGGKDLSEDVCCLRTVGVRSVGGSLYGTYRTSVSWWRDEMHQVFVSFLLCLCVWGSSRNFWGRYDGVERFVLLL